jgi:glycosyltransferase involved in cell wall biosynthesis
MSQKGVVVILSNTHWHSSWQTGNSVAAGLAARGYAVFFVEPIPKRWPRLSEIKRVIGRLTGRTHQAGSARQPIPNGVHLVSPLALPDVGPLTQALNRRLFAPRVAARLRSLAGDRRPLILIHTLPLPTAVAIQQALAPDLAIYRCVYDWPNDPYSGRKLSETALLQVVDLAWADCDYNLRRLQAVRPEASLMLPAVDLSLFTAVSYAKSGRAKPLCLYFGSVGVNRDISLLSKISHRYHLRLVGPVNCSLDTFSPDTEIVGPVSHEQVPALIRDADILLLLYGSHPSVAGVIPAKFFECLITGKPIVATNLTSVDEYRRLIYQCDSHEAVFEAIETAVNEPPHLATERIACAVENSWERRLSQMEEQINAALAEKNERPHPI